MNPEFLNIPASLCFYALQKKCLSQFQLYCWLKTKCSGHFKLTNQLMFTAYHDLSINRQTFNSRINWLLKNKWIGLNSKTGNYHLNSFNVIHRRMKLSTKTGIIWDKYDFKNFNAFVYTAIFTTIARNKWWIDQQKLREIGRKPQKAGMHKGRSRKCLGFRSYSLPLEYLAKAIGISIPTVCRMKAEAKKAGFIEVKHQFKKIEIEPSQFANYRKFTDEPHKTLLFHNKPFEQLPDLITPFVVAKKRCNLKQNRLEI